MDELSGGAGLYGQLAQYYDKIYSFKSYGDEAADPRQGEKATICYRMRLLTLHLWNHWKAYSLGPMRPFGMYPQFPSTLHQIWNGHRSQGCISVWW